VIGQLAAERLFHRLAGSAEPSRRIEAPLRLIVRGSGELRP
jgi:LacI family transcriptional regulator